MDQVIKIKKHSVQERHVYNDTPRSGFNSFVRNAHVGSID